MLLVAVSACGYGSGALFAKPVYAAGLDWLTLLAWRFLFGAALSWAWLLLWPGARSALRTLSRRRLLVLLGLGVFFVGNSATYFAALETVPASLAALIVYLYPALVAVLAIRFARRLRGRRTWLALGLATLGVALAVGGIDPTRMPPPAGLLLALASPVIYAVWIVLSMRLSGERPEGGQLEPYDAPGAALRPAEDAQPPAGDDRHGPVDDPGVTRADTHPAPSAALMLTATWALYWLAAAVTGRPVDPGRIPAEAWPGLLGVGIFSTAVAIQAFYAGARRIGAAQAALVSTVEPIYTITLASVLFGETLAPVQLLGGALVIGGVLLAQSDSLTLRAEPLRRLVQRGT